MKKFRVIIKVAVDIKAVDTEHAEAVISEMMYSFNYPYGNTDLVVDSEIREPQYLSKKFKNYLTS